MEVKGGRGLRIGSARLLQVLFYSMLPYPVILSIMELVYEVVSARERERERMPRTGRAIGAADWPPPLPLKGTTQWRGRRIACCVSYLRGYFGPFQQSLVVILAGAHLF